MKKAACYVDGLNLFHAIKDKPSANINLGSLGASLVRPGFELAAVYYFSAYATWRPADYRKHRQYVQQLQSVGVVDVMSHFKKKPANCHSCGARWWSHEEKETDVRLCLQLTKDAEDDVFDTAYVFSGDSDIVPAIEQVKERHPEKRIYVVLPKHQVKYARNVSAVCDGVVNLSPARIASHTF